MASITVFHNPNCSKSRGACSILGERGVEFDSVQYLKTPPTRDEIVALIGILDDPPAALVRKDPYFRELGLDAADYETVDAVADLLAEHPRLMERPVIVKDGRAVIGRPPERVLELLEPD
ncbi:MAG: arsenate reductase family protein [Acidimicrobiia bacterium]